MCFTEGYQFAIDGLWFYSQIVCQLNQQSVKINSTYDLKLNFSLVKTLILALKQKYHTGGGPWSYFLNWSSLKLFLHLSRLISSLVLCMHPVQVRKTSWNIYRFKGTKGTPNSPIFGPDKFYPKTGCFIYCWLTPFRWQPEKMIHNTFSRCCRKS